MSCPREPAAVWWAGGRPTAEQASSAPTQHKGRGTQTHREGGRGGRGEEGGREGEGREEGGREEGGRGREEGGGRGEMESSMRMCKQKVHNSHTQYQLKLKDTKASEQLAKALSQQGSFTRIQMVMTLFQMSP